MLVFADEDMQETVVTVSGGMSRYKGTLSRESAIEFQKFAEEIRGEWDRDI